MDKYNSLAKQLIQSGILPDDVQNPIIENNFFKSPNGILSKEDEINPETEPKNLENKKRINQYDLEFLEDEKQTVSKGFIGNIKNILKKDEQKVLFKIFPNLQKAKIAKETIDKLQKLNIDTQKLLDKSIPYGENDLRYKNLVKYLSVVNEVNSKINKN